MEKHSLLTDESIEAWIAGHDPEGLTKLRQRLIGGQVRGVRARCVEDWFDRKSNVQAALSAAEKRALELRAVEAQERAANRATWALWVSVAALLIAAWPYIPKG